MEQSRLKRFSWKVRAIYLKKKEKFLSFFIIVQNKIKYKEYERFSMEEEQNSWINSSNSIKISFDCVIRSKQKFQKKKKKLNSPWKG